MALVRNITMLGLAAGLLPFAIHAQQQPPQQQATLEEIVVTAQKRSENVQNVPIAVSTIDNSTMQKAHIETTQDLQFAVPSLVYNNAANNAQPFLRGIGSDTNGPNYDVSVATYVDGVFISSNSGVIQNLLGVERVEVLEGPQGTLYGRNAVGGAINVYTLTPTEEFKNETTVGVGNYNEYTVKGYVSGGVASNLAVGAYYVYQVRDTYYNLANPFPHDPTLGDVTQPTHNLNAGGRVKAVWTPTDAIKLTGSAEYTNFNSFDMGAFRNVQANGAGYAFPVPRTIQPYYLDSNQPQETEIHSTALTLREEVDVGWANVLGITGWRNLNLTGYDDLDGTSAPIAGTGAPHSPSKQFSQELQLVSPTGSAITWIAGLYYFHEYTGYNPVITNSAILFQPATFTISADNADVTTDSYAAFGQATIPLSFITDAFKLTLGARYTEDKKSITANGFLMTNLGGSVVPDSIQQFPDASKSWGKFTPKVGLDYKPGDTLFYASYGKGFKSGAFNISTPSIPETYVGPENLTAYELGTKSDFFDGRVRVNNSAYYYTLKDLQVQIVSGGESGRTGIENAAGGQAYGLESNISAAVTTELKANVGLAWEHTKYTNFDNAASFAISTGPVGALNINPAAVYDATGNELQRAPKFVSTVGADYTHVLGNGGSIGATAKWYFNDGFFWEPTNRFKQPAYNIVNVSAGYTLADQHTSVRGYVTNLTNQYYANSVLLVPFGILQQDGEPRMYGINVTFSF